jgi:GDP-L-fucose synthase
VTGYAGEIVYDRSKPDGTPRKLMDSSRLAHLGWQPRIGLEQGLEHAYRWFLSSAAGRARA